MSSVSFLPPYYSARPNLRVLGALLILMAAISWTAAGVDWALLHLAGEIRAGFEITRADRMAHLRTAATVSSVQFGCMLLTGLVFFSWLYQVRVNVRALGMRKLRWRREWTVLGFLIPGLNLVRPYQVVREIWQASDPRSADAMSWRELQVSPLLLSWWATFLAFLAFELVAWMILLGTDTAGERRMAYSLRALADVSAGVSASLAYFVAVRITEAQDTKHAERDPADEALEFETLRTPHHSSA